MELWQWLGDLHPKLVQFPLVLLLVGLLFDLYGLCRRPLEASARAHWAGMAVTGMGTLGLLFAFICGIYAEIWAGRAGIPQHPIELHELMANIAAWGFVVLLAWRIFLTGEKRRALKIYVGIGLFWYVLLAITGYLGGQLVFQYGAAVAGPGRGELALTLSDLNVLATRQTDLNLRYSEWMHHIFGWMTLGLAASLLAQAIWPRHSSRLKWIVPAFLLAGGIFLFFCADLDLYPSFTDPRQWRDREVQLHKTLALIMGTIGAAGLAKIMRKPASSEGSVAGSDSLPATESRPTEEPRSNSKLVAVLALIGGAMLFTHVHTVAPYANVAAGVYIAHVVLGLIALSIGATRLLQDFFPAKKRPLALAFGGLMAIESVLLITYNEGLPWYIGYGTYSRWGPTRDAATTVAPFGDFRAVMYVDPIEGHVYVGIRQRIETVVGDETKAQGVEDSVTLTLDEMPQLIVSRGYQETSIPLVRSKAPGEVIPPGKELTGSNFRGRAEFLRTTPFVTARLVLKRNGKREVGYFDPWVTPIIAAVPPNEVAKYECPMHAGIRSMEPGKCRMCGMDLLEIRTPRPAEELHDAGYAMGVEVDQKAATKQLAAGPLVLRPGPVETGKSLLLAIVHEQPIHLIITSEDLAYFDHVHPSPLAGADGPNVPYFLDYAFPRPGRYLLFADYTPVGDRAQVFRVPLEVTEAGVKLATDTRDNAVKLSVDEVRGRMVATFPAGLTPQDSAAFDKIAPRHPADWGGDVHVDLITQPQTLWSGLHSNLVFRITEGRAGGQPAVDLMPLLGAMGHCVIISEDTQLFLHCHPTTFATPNTVDRGGPEVAFHTVFPKAGRYRIWGQFKRPGEKPGEPIRLVIADFTVDVKDPPVPASLIRFLLGD